MIKEKKLIYTDLAKNSNKFYNIRLLENGNVEAEWGRVREVGGEILKQESTVYSGGERKFESVLRSKLRKGYTELKVLTEETKEETVVNQTLESLALTQIETNHEDVSKLIKYLIQSNIHNITSNSKISYNINTGSFSTPFGLVTQEGINEARNVLADIKECITIRNFGEDLEKYANQYLRIIPKDIGRSRTLPENIFTPQEIQRQLDILEGSEASLTQVTNNSINKSGQQENNKLFNVRLELVTDKEEQTRVEKAFYTTSKDMHMAAKGFKFRAVYRVIIRPMQSAFEKIATEKGNIHELFHGTKSQNVLSILKSGFQVTPPATAFIAGKNFGNGIYFANCSTKSLQYCTSFWGGEADNRAYMFLNDVAIGNYYVPPHTTSSNPPNGYDSYWAKAGQTSFIQNDEIVVFNPAQVNPTYLMEFEK